MNQVFGLFNARTALNDFLLLHATILSESQFECCQFNISSLTFCSTGAGLEGEKKCL